MVLGSVVLNEVGTNLFMVSWSPSKYGSLLVYIYEGCVLVTLCTLHRYIAVADY
jgi:hypothetical protein